MTPRERRSLAEQLHANPLTEIILGEIEKRATERLIYAKTEPERIEAQAAVHAARNFAATLRIALNTSPGNDAP